MFSLFSKKKRYYGRLIDIMETNRHQEGEVTVSQYSIVLHNSQTVVGDCDLRVGMNDELYYAGNIGYNIIYNYRGNGYAYEACRLLFEVAKEKFHMKELIITCSPDNIASRKTLERLSGVYCETTPVPSSHWLYKRGEMVKNIYRYTL